eukprot:TRINITY_DN2312_c0_g2_i4.p1 TRINITY_DN2312_c0_g2~~TRINITY_DN2312_c0_g2_i4.p1  ORF type:complete len:526 (+),score=125.48 TRINITY_DN2312_c0_g2_i4:197-1774(+)
MFKVYEDQRYTKNFEEIREFARGKHASVHLVRSRIDGNTYTVKKIRLGGVKGTAESKQARIEAILREASHLAKISNPNIVRYYASWVEEEDLPGHYEKGGQCKLRRESSSLIDLDNFRLEPELDTAALENVEFVSESVVSFEELSPPREVKRKRSILECLQELNSRKSSETIEVPRFATVQRETTIYIQTEVTEATLEQYMTKRNDYLFSLYKTDREKFATESARFQVEAKYIVRQILNAVEYLHEEKKLAHLGISPSSIFIDRSLQVKIGEFGSIQSLTGMSRHSSPNISYFTSSQTYSIFGSPERRSFDEEKKELPYLELSRCYSAEPYRRFQNFSSSAKLFASPEQLMKNDPSIDQKSDIWSVALVIILLYYPTSTFMERDAVLRFAREGTFPLALEKEQPGLIAVLREMLSLQGPMRIDISKVREALFAGGNDMAEVLVRKEGSSVWKRKFIRSHSRTLYLFQEKNSAKAQTILELTDSSNVNFDTTRQVIVINSELQKSLELRGESFSITQNILWMVLLC